LACADAVVRDLQLELVRGCWIRATGQEAIGELGTLLAVARGEPDHSREPQPTLDDLDRLLATTRDAGLPVERAAPDCAPRSNSPPIEAASEEPDAFDDAGGWRLRATLPLPS
jgi:hypothetical protein